MPILSEPVIDPIAELKAATRAELLKFCREAYVTLTAMQNAGINGFWRRENLTPQQVSDALGTDAAALFAFHGRLTELVATLAVQDGLVPPIILPPNAFQYNADGSITILEKPYGT